MLNLGRGNGRACRLDYRVREAKISDERRGEVSRDSRNCPVADMKPAR